jgi:hypothetical protein
MFWNIYSVKLNAGLIVHTLCRLCYKWNALMYSNDLSVYYASCTYSGLAVMWEYYVALRNRTILGGKNNRQQRKQLHFWIYIHIHILHTTYIHPIYTYFTHTIAAIAVKGEQNAVDHCGNNCNCCIVQFLYYSDVDQIMRKSLLVSVFFGKKTLKKYVDMFLACPKSKVTIKLKVYYSE